MFSASVGDQLSFVFTAIVGGKMVVMHGSRHDGEVGLEGMRESV